MLAPRVRRVHGVLGSNAPRDWLHRCLHGEARELLDIVEHDLAHARVANEVPYDATGKEKGSHGTCTAMSS